MYCASQSGGDGARDVDEKHRFISLPGVPYEMKYLVENEIIQRL
jgi:molybdopterin-biosynthesis enzyme MoeA-like protein